jgi:hypothetical protein
LVDQLLDWFEHHYGKQPAESAVKHRVSAIYRAFRFARDMKAKNPRD